MMSPYGSFSHNVAKIRSRQAETRDCAIDPEDVQEYFVGDTIQHKSGTVYKIMRLANELNLPVKVLYVDKILKGRAPGDFQAGYKQRELHKQKQQPTGGSTMNMTQRLNSTNIIDAVTSSIASSKKTIIVNQKGTAVLTVLRTTIQKNPLVPEQLKTLLLDETYGDFILGTLLNITAQIFSNNMTIKSAAQAANVVGTYDMSNQFNRLEEFIESTITSVMEPLSDVLSKDDDTND